MRFVPPRYDAGEHATAVAVVHEVLLHSTDSSSDAEGLGSIEAKLSPLMVTDTPPVCAAFAGLMLLTAGAAHTEQRSGCCTSHGAQPQAPVPSKVNCKAWACVPTSPATVTAVRLVPPRYDAAAHATAVADVHEVLLHCTDSSSDTEGVWSFESKASPLMVTGKANPPVCAAFAELMLVKAGAAHSEQRSCSPKAHSGAGGRTVEAEAV